MPVATDVAPAARRDVDSTWAARPVPEAEQAATRPPLRDEGVTSEPSPSPAPSASYRPGGRGDADDDADASAAPSYDYLFGHTTAADEHRKVLAQLTQPAHDDGTHEDDHDDEVLSVPAVADASSAAVTNAAPAPEAPERPIPSAPEGPERGLISSVPWATPSSAPAPEPAAEAPTFSGRHTPPAAPSLLPPVHTPPAGARAPEATPLISTGPPPAAPHQPATNQPGTNQPGMNQPEQWAVPHATPVLRTPPTVPISTTAPTQPSVPASAPPPPPPPPPPSAPQPLPAVEPSFDVPLAADASDDETELTVDRTALLEARNAAQHQTFSGPSVLAVLCSAGHPTPPHGDRCRVCGASIPPQEPFTMPRPPLGVLRLSTGDVVTLDRSVLLGRAPKPGEGLTAHDRPHVVKVPSPERDVSRNHVEVILEGWHVLIRDLGTTNGTTVTLPGDTPVRLRANDQQVLEPGSFVSMADEVSFTFEAAP